MPYFLPSELAKWCGGKWEMGEPESIDGVSNDTRSLERGNLYFALKGPNFDGHDYIDDAVMKGACGSVVATEWFRASGSRVQGSGRGSASGNPPSTGLSRKSGLRQARSQAGLAVPLLVVDDPAKALRDVAAEYRKKVNPLVVAVTGSFGKSTVKEITADMLSAIGVTARTRMNWNNNIGVPLSILAMERDSRFGVFEAGINHPGELGPLCEILKPSVGVVTGIGPVHIGFFDSIKAIAEEKVVLLRALGNDCIAILNIDDKFYGLLRTACSCRVITVSMKPARNAGSGAISGAGRPEADYLCVSRDSAGGEVRVREKGTGDEFMYIKRFPGEYNILNAMFAIAVARGQGVEWGEIKKVLNNFNPLPMRWQEEEIKGVIVINDAYNANPVSMRSAVEAFIEKKVTGKKWLVLGGMLELGNMEKDFHTALGEYIAHSNLDCVIVIGLLGKLIADGCIRSGSGLKRVIFCENNNEAAGLIEKEAKKGDAVLLKASRAIHLEEIVVHLKR